MNTERKLAQPRDALLRLVSCKIGGEELGIDISLVCGNAKTMQLSKASRNLELIEGTIDLGGRTIHAIDLRKRIRHKNKDEREETIVMVVDIPGKAFGFLIDAAKEEVHIRSKEGRRTFAKDDRMIIRAKNKPHMINVSDILYIKAEKEYSIVFLLSGPQFSVRKSIKQWEEQLPNDVFLRIHRSTIINTEQIAKIEKWYKRSYVIHLKNIDHGFVISQRYFSKIRSRFAL